MTMDPSSAPTNDTVLRPGDRVRVCFGFARWVGRHATAVLTVATLTRTEDGVTILGLQRPPARASGGVRARGAVGSGRF